MIESVLGFHAQTLVGNSNREVTGVLDSAAKLNSILSSKWDTECTESIGNFSSDDSSFDDMEQGHKPSSYVKSSSGRRIDDIFKLDGMSSLSRPRSESPETDVDISRSLGMHRIRSMPNLEYGRSAHNRSTGQTMIESVPEYDKAKGKTDAAENIMEFETLFAEL
jgi:hypothetical protein